MPSRKGSAMILLYTCISNCYDYAHILFRYRGGEVDNQFSQAGDRSYYVNISNDGTYASADGVKYYCTASNDFGTIRSRNATASIASEWGCGYGLSLC